MNESDTIKKSYELLLRYAKLHIDYAKLTAAEKLTVAVATIAFYALIALFGIVTLIFISIGIGHMLASTIAPQTAYLFVAAFYIVLLAALAAFRKRLIFDPVARFFSKLLLKAPDGKKD